MNVDEKQFCERSNAVEQSAWKLYRYFPSTPTPLAWHQLKEVDRQAFMMLAQAGLIRLRIGAMVTPKIGSPCETLCEASGFTDVEQVRDSLRECLGLSGQAKVDLCPSHVYLTASGDASRKRLLSSVDEWHQAICPEHHQYEFRHLIVDAAPPSVNTPPVHRNEAENLSAATASPTRRSRSEDKAMVLRGILLGDHFNLDGRLTNREPHSIASVQSRIQNGAAARPCGWSNSAVSKLFKEVFGQDGHSRYAHLLTNDPAGLRRLLDDKRGGRERLDGNRSVDNSGDW